MISKMNVKLCKQLAFECFHEAMSVLDELPLNVHIYMIPNYWCESFREGSRSITLVKALMPMWGRSSSILPMLYYECIVGY